MAQNTPDTAAMTNAATTIRSVTHKADISSGKLATNAAHTSLGAGNKYTGT